MNNQTVQDNIKQYDVFFAVICPSTAVFCLALNLISLKAFSNSTIFKEEIYNYFRMETFFICINLFIASLRPIYYDIYSELSKSYFAQILIIYFLIYVTSLLEMSATLTQIAACLKYYLMVTKANMNCFDNLSYEMVTLVIFVFSCLMYVYQCFQFDISAQFLTINNVTKTYYAMEANSFFKSDLRKSIEIGAFVIRDGINSIVLIIMNILIYISIKKYAKKKHSLFANKFSTETSTQRAISNMESSETLKKISVKVGVMVLMTCLNCLFGRTPILFSYLYRNVSNDAYALYLVDRLAVLTVHLSYGFYFFIYLLTNNKFRSLVINFFTHPFTVVRSNYRKYS
jgi:hypothetical protein